jgi:hypothetical protein
MTTQDIICACLEQGIQLTGEDAIHLTQFCQLHGYDPYMSNMDKMCIDLGIYEEAA